MDHSGVLHQAWVLEADEEVTGQDGFVTPGQEGMVLEAFKMPCGERDGQGREGMVIRCNIIELLWKVVLSRGEEVLNSLVLAKVGMKGSVFEVASHGGDDQRP